MATKAEKITAKVAKWISGEDTPATIASFNQYTMLEYITQKKDKEYLTEYAELVKKHTDKITNSSGKIKNYIYDWKAIREEFAYHYPEFRELSKQGKKEKKEAEAKNKGDIPNPMEEKIKAAKAAMEEKAAEQQDTPIEENK